MAYTPLSWVAGETVTATKMNIGAANMAGFNDGTAIGDAAIINRHLSAEAVTSDNIDFETFPTVTTNAEAVNANITSATYATIASLTVENIPSWANKIYFFAPLNQQKISSGTAIVDIYSKLQVNGADITPQIYVRQSVVNQYEGVTQPLCGLTDIPSGATSLTLTIQHRGNASATVNTGILQKAIIAIPVRC